MGQHHVQHSSRYLCGKSGEWGVEVVEGIIYRPTEQTSGVREGKCSGTCKRLKSGKRNHLFHGGIMDIRKISKTNITIPPLYEYQVCSTLK